MASRWQLGVRCNQPEIWTSDLSLQRRMRYRTTNWPVTTKKILFLCSGMLFRYKSRFGFLHNEREAGVKLVLSRFSFLASSQSRTPHILVVQRLLLGIWRSSVNWCRVQNQRLSHQSGRSTDQVQAKILRRQCRLPPRKLQVKATYKGIQVEKIFAWSPLKKVLQEDQLHQIWAFYDFTVTKYDN